VGEARRAAPSLSPRPLRADDDPRDDEVVPEQPHEYLLDRMRAEQARAPTSAEWRQPEAELEASGIDTTDLGIFSSVAPTRFDYESAAPILIRWLPRMHDPVEKEVLARSLQA
jgi:hypothetical protein